MLDIRELVSGDVLFHEGDVADTAYIIESGELEISTQTDGNKVVICSLVDGDIVGEMGIIDDEPRNCNTISSRS